MNILSYSANNARYFSLLFHESIDDWNRYFNDPPSETNTDGSKIYWKTDSPGKYFVTDCKFGDLKATCIFVNSVGPNYLGISETEFNKCSGDIGVPCTVFYNGSFFQYRVTGKDCTMTSGTCGGIHTGVLVRENSKDLNLIEETSISGYSSETSGSVLWHKNGNVSFISINESNCKTKIEVAYQITNEPSGISHVKFCQFISAKSDEKCFYYEISQHFIQCSSFLNNSYSSKSTTSPGIFYLATPDSILTIANSVIKDNSGTALLFTNYGSSIIVDRCFIENPNVQMISVGYGNFQFIHKYFIYILNVPHKNCIFTDVKYKTIYVNKLCRCDSNFIYYFAFLSK
ncbi:hypothetical protein TVAG_361330 [Trichomonas vaginalis G3]|uniref:Uncharacterized protein n=1 Tax=Trichomonas vaginalis (strain ATCC PRA-98 / G3) TaxID=412133 RepID=A2FY50_TRIV3|nr:hypothetical protein TVAGG3_0337220 [Trichomonas vaginalis G3]EAX90160.1 hypothetical protein TVAG_361330 [Trichomonas vaginalis G3]KAI5530363.1 hypothetical protein TVAGG3_0337220 [Trichomonas vaginalis G3]|eukprot:XP_001303090.1 hypothetical protein [Trichomonas vaginalis G3]